MNLYDPTQDEFLLYANERKERFLNRRASKAEHQGEFKKPKRAVLKQASKWSFSFQDLDDGY